MHTVTQCWVEACWHSIRTCNETNFDKVQHGWDCECKERRIKFGRVGEGDQIAWTYWLVQMGLVVTSETHAAEKMADSRQSDCHSTYVEDKGKHVNNTMYQ